jgi:Protein of unknown function (DUF1553)/Protein of unknown function (DUF1549)/Planctomycete cytochrome C
MIRPNDACQPLFAYLVLLCVASLARSSVEDLDFVRDVAPILMNRCIECHNAIDKTGGLDLTNFAGLRAGGEGGEVIVEGKPEASELVLRVEAHEMPPPKDSEPKPVTLEEIERLRNWITQGAKWPEGRVLDRFESTSQTRAGRDWWSLQPIVRPSVPKLEAGSAAANPIDAFLLSNLHEHGWNYAPPADRRILVRRLYQDLVGLPPTAEELDALEQDPAPDWYERLVDRLLDSPHFGERWGRHWLDVARYAETCGYERDQEKPFAWKYRDWVIRAFNDDMPFDRFILEQLAGDELPDRSESSVIATGFLRLGTWNDEPNDPEEYKYERLEDLVHTTSTAFLGLTVKCARCHDHKFDPIRQTDYYRMASTFWAGPIEPAARELLGGPDSAALGYAEVLGWTDRGREPPPLHLLKKGDPARPGPVVEPGTLSIVPKLERPLAPPSPADRLTTRRLQLAQWIIDPANPLPPRVWVNRLWQHHFGHGLVRSPDNFGFNGEKPTHPALLDWLAAEFVAEGWKSKPIHRLIVLSNGYQQMSSRPDQTRFEASDAGNRLWWRAERRRLDAECLRDALLAVGGNLNLSRMGGPSFRPTIASDALEGLSMKSGAWTPSPREEQDRRSVYLYAKRGLLSPMMTAFDFMDTTIPCGQRDVTLVSPQALTLLNNEFVHEQSQALARRVAEQATDADSQIRLAWRLALGRSPTRQEAELAADHLNRQARRFAASENADLRSLESLCHVLINSNECLYVD